MRRVKSFRMEEVRRRLEEEAGSWYSVDAPPLRARIAGWVGHYATFGQNRARAVDIFLVDRKSTGSKVLMRKPQNPPHLVLVDINREGVFEDS